MFNNIYKNKYLRYTNSDSADDENDNDITESENNSRNIDLIVNKLENKLNENNNMKMTSQNQETTRTSKMNESNINNFPNLIQKNIRIKEYETSLDIGDSIYSVNSLPKNKIGKSLIDVDISLNSNNLKEIEKEKEKEKEEKDNKNNKDLIKIINESNNKNNYITRNKILNTGNSSLNTLSTQFDNSKYFLTKTNANLILSNKIKKNPKENKNNINMNLKLTINEESNNKVKEIGTNNKNNSNKKNKKENRTRNKIKIKKKRKCNFIAILRNIFLTIIISSAIGFYVVVFIC